ncbi:hypothetical protein PTSG_09442 [Salpingoeca rosetta]|uniref:Uncharacterized protein n=1 Tax=Salpingoeca rosetta (strain ATCC 50818 / BSB-021) TaxID=946362 RepID=F2UMM6_SALR5|nr:uncharacterized protein PTSG_09442 [Salpingoeca rosetta]EGD78375.1 hypothetical protein PTSG_09442 [Salpingoeca rosetta]|eukprot:XP_004989698.1 hypothetical protein PTSG_09442 [Salpingoeca rosetta]
MDDILPPPPPPPTPPPPPEQHINYNDHADNNNNIDYDDDDDNSTNNCDDNTDNTTDDMQASDLPPPPPAMMDEDAANEQRDSLRAVFMAYSKAIPCSSTTSGDAPQRKRVRRHMTGWHFIKACRDAKVLKRTGLSRIDCDIAFSKFKNSHNALTFKQFANALAALNERPNCTCDVVQRVASFAQSLSPSSPSSSSSSSSPEMKQKTKKRHGSSSSSSSSSRRSRRPSTAPSTASAPRTTVVSDYDDELPPLFRRLTDPRLYTGSHKHRFDEQGAGKGLYGRDSIPKGKGIPVSTCLGFETALRTASDVRGVPLATLTASSR